MAEHFGYGQMTPEDQSSDFNVVAFIVRQMMARLETTKVVKVVAVHGGGPAAPPPTVDVQPLVSQVDGFNNSVQHGVVYGLPVLRLQAGAAAIVLDPKVDDVGFVVVADRDISAAKASPGEVVTPGSGRKFDLADGIYCGGILNGAPSTYIEFLDDGHLKIATADGNVLETSASGFAITGNLTVTGDITSGFGTPASVRLRTHTHGGVTVGAGISGPATPGT
jgi:hypothetical protein